MDARDDLWRELSETMRSLREAHQVSLRALELLGRWGRGTLSQVETGKMRPTADLIDFYEKQFDADGSLRSRYLDIRAQEADGVPTTAHAEHKIEGDACELRKCTLPTGTLVPPGATLEFSWSLRNAGSVEWRSRRLIRLGPTGGSRIVTSAPAFLVPDCSPGELVTVLASIIAPSEDGTVVAYWRMADSESQYCFDDTEACSVTVVVNPQAHQPAPILRW